MCRLDLYETPHRPQFAAISKQVCRVKGYLVFHQDTLKVPAPLNPSDKRGKTREEDPLLSSPLVRGVGGYGGLGI